MRENGDRRVQSIHGAITDHKCVCVICMLVCLSSYDLVIKS